MPSGSMANVKIDNKWMKLKLPQCRSSWIKKELTATNSIKPTQV
jgi:hypothetical protein